MRNYQRKTNNPYYLPHNVYMQTLYLVRDYDRLRGEVLDIIYAGVTPDGFPRGPGVGNPTESKATKIENAETKIRAIETALLSIEPEYRKGVLDNVCYGSPYPIDASYETYGRKRRKFLYAVAQQMGSI